LGVGRAEDSAALKMIQCGGSTILTEVREVEIIRKGNYIKVTIEKNGMPHQGIEGWVPAQLANIPIPAWEPVKNDD